MNPEKPYDKEIGDEICSRLANGESLRKICETGDYPSRPTIYKWLRQSDVFRAQYAESRSDQADSFADDVTEIADNDTYAPDDKRVRIDARKWCAGKLRPKKYGDSTLIKHADADGEKLSFANILAQIDGRTAGLPGIERPASGQDVEVK